MLRYRPYFNKDKACAWINSMADDGWALRGFGGGFWNFERCAPGMYRYAIGYEGFSGQGQQECVDFMDNPGVTTVGRWGPWVVLQQTASEGPLRLYTDSTSSIEQRKKILTFFRFACIIELLCFVTLCLVIMPESDWSWSAILATCTAGGLTLVFAIRCFQLKDEIWVLQSGSDELRTGHASQRGRVFIAVGLSVMIGGLLLKAGSPHVGDFLLGFSEGFGGVFVFMGLLGLLSR